MLSNSLLARPSRRLAALHSWVLCAALAFASPAHGGPEAAPPASDSDVAREASLEVRLLNSSSIPDAAFYGALAAALSRPLDFDATLVPDPAQAQLAIVYDTERHELTISYYAPGQGTVTRIIQAPEDVNEVPEAVALLAVNLTMTEAEVAVASPPSSAPRAEPAPPPAPAGPARSARAAAMRPLVRPANASLFYPLATNYNAPQLKTHLSVNLLYGVIGELDGLEVGTVNVVQGKVRGLQAGLLLNGVARSLQGLQVAGLISSAERLTPGVQMAGLATHSRSETRGLQVAFGANTSGGALSGAQLSFVGNYAGGSAQAFQGAGVLNLAGNLRGMQASTLFNYAGDVTGAQVGLINIARRVKGTQVGLVNIADDIEGVPIGFANVTKSGGVHVAAWASNTAYANLGLRMATRYTFTMITLGYHHTGTHSAAGPGVILGVRVPVAKRFAVDIDVGGDYLVGTRLCCYPTRGEERLAHANDRQHYRLRFVPTWQATPQFSLFAGGGLSARVPFALYSGFRGSDRSVSVGPEFLLGMAL